MGKIKNLFRFNKKTQQQIDQENQEREQMERAEQEKERKKEEEKYNKPFIPNTLEPQLRKWDETIQNDIDEKAEHGYEPISIATASPPSSPDYITILYKKTSLKEKALRDWWESLPEEVRKQFPFLWG